MYDTCGIALQNPPAITTDAQKKQRQAASEKCYLIHFMKIRVRIQRSWAADTFRKDKSTPDRLGILKPERTRSRIWLCRYRICLSHRFRTMGDRRKRCPLRPLQCLLIILHHRAPAACSFRSFRSSRCGPVIRCASRCLLLFCLCSGSPDRYWPIPAHTLTPLHFLSILLLHRPGHVENEYDHSDNHADKAHHLSLLT